jgi:hypothetical protein
MTIREKVRQRLGEIVEYSWPHDAAVKLWSSEVHEDEEPIDALARHMADFFEKEMNGKN